jgi:hypothetical protein
MHAKIGRGQIKRDHPPNFDAPAEGSNGIDKMAEELGDPGYLMLKPNYFGRLSE